MDECKHLIVRRSRRQWLMNDETIDSYYGLLCPVCYEYTAISRGALFSNSTHPLHKSTTLTPSPAITDHLLHTFHRITHVSIVVCIYIRDTLCIRDNMC